MYSTAESRGCVVCGVVCVYSTAESRGCVECGVVCVCTVQLRAGAVW